VLVRFPFTRQCLVLRRWYRSSAFRQFRVAARDRLEAAGITPVASDMEATDESAILARMRRHQEAGATDPAARIVPLGEDATARTQSRQRTQESLASICPALQPVRLSFAPSSR